MKHEWKLDDKGDVDIWALDVDDLDGDNHNGPECVRCGRLLCVHCVPNYDDEECSGDKEIGRDLMGNMFATPEDWE